MSDEVGVIGLGLLGNAIATRLSEAGYRVVGYDLQLPEESSAHLCDSAREVFSKCRKIFFSLPTSEDSAAVIDEVESELSAGQIIMDSTTGSPGQLSRIAAGLAKAGVHYLETNVAGSSEQLRKGEAVLLIGGEEERARELDPLFRCLAPYAPYIGPAGSASRFKLVHNLILGLNRAALAEGLQFAEALGFDGESALAILNRTAAASGAMTGKGKRMAERNYDQPQARLAQHLKDVRLMLAEAESSGARIPFTEVHRELLEKLVEQGFGPADNSAIMEAFDREDGGIASQ